MACACPQEQSWRLCGRGLYDVQVDGHQRPVRSELPKGTSSSAGKGGLCGASAHPPHACMHEQKLIAYHGGRSAQLLYLGYKGCEQIPLKGCAGFPGIGHHGHRRPAAGRPAAAL